ncbi:hypothetical protein [Paucibacter sp. XJ19-41]|uniref:hypothetical protein n=1 Tax=Paucibacter sp. XJ19-41 TaxID=2927824 RepID=UPI002349C6EC|nr:hypothetical protein [Paucibacter sp. XJ19-41]MDC6168862.1 hypothetical protein [Paucibacter sp. XJ19-41]
MAAPKKIRNRGALVRDKGTTGGGGGGSTTPSVHVSFVAVDSEEAAFQQLQLALRDQFPEGGVSFVFENWPKLTIKLEGVGYNSTITPDLAEVLVNLQHALNRAYARAIHHSTNARKLTAEERRRLQFKAKVEKGSSLINVDLGPYAQQLATELSGKMNANDIIITVLGLGAIAATTVAFKTWLKHKSDDNKVDADTKERIALSQEETKRQHVLATALASKPELDFARQEFDDLRRDVLKAVADARTVQLNGLQFTAGEARALSNTPRTESQDVQLNGHYVIQKVDLSDPVIIRLSVKSSDNSDEFIATLKRGGLEDDESARLESGAWNRRRLYMAINGTRLRGEVTTATIVSVDWPKDKPAA